MFDKSKIIQAIRNMPNQMPSEEETVEIILYFKTAISQVLKKRGLKIGTQLNIRGKIISWSTDDQISPHKKAIGTEHEIEQELFMEFFSLKIICETGEEGWIEKNLNTLQGLDDEEIWRRFDNRALNVLRHSIPKSHMEKIDEKRPQRQWLPTELPPDVVEQCYEAMLPEKTRLRYGGADETLRGDDAWASKACDALQAFDRSMEPMKKKLDKHMDKLIDNLMEIKIEKIPDFKDFYNEVRYKFYNQPQTFIRHLQNKFKDQPLINRYLMFTFPSEESFRAIYDRKGFLKELLLKYGDEWEIILAKIAIKEEAKKKLKSGMSPKGKQVAVQEMKEFYRKWLPDLNSQHILRYAKSEIKKELKDFDKILQNFAHLLYEHILKANQNQEND